MRELGWSPVKARGSPRADSGIRIGGMPETLAIRRDRCCRSDSVEADTEGVVTTAFRQNGCGLGVG
jgi:hypothetical protein